MVSINTNLSSLIVQKNLANSTLSLNQAIERMTTGFKINHAKDNAANYSIAEKMSSQITSYQMAEENAMMGIDMIQTAQSSVEQMTNLTIRLRDLAEQAQNGTYGTQSIAAINQEAQSIVQEISRIQQTTEYNGISVLTSNTERIKEYEATGVTTTFAVNALGYDAKRVVLYGNDIGVSADHYTSSTILCASGASGMMSSDTTKVSNYDSANITSYGKFFNSPTIVGNGSGNVSGASGASDVSGVSGVNGTNGTIYISNKEEFLSIFSGYNFYENCTYVLTNDIDLAGEEMQACLNGSSIHFYGQGHVIKNVKNASGGLFDHLEYSTIQDVGFENLELGGTGIDYVGGIVNNASCSVTISNCYISGDVYIEGNDAVGGFVGRTCGAGGASDVNGLTISYSYIASDIDMVATYFLGNYKEGYFVGLLNDRDKVHQFNNVGILDLVEIVEDESPPDIFSTSLQVGIGPNQSDRIDLRYEMPAMTLDALVSSGLESSNSLAIIDKYLSSLNTTSVKLGAAENRLMSACESISVAYDNLISSRSTLRDADIAKESSQYIKAQILQQASATLLATANQTPSITLSLLGSLI